MLKIESSKCITTVHHWSSVCHSFGLNFTWNLQISILLDTLYETIKSFRFIRFIRGHHNKINLQNFWAFVSALNYYIGYYFEITETAIIWSIAYILRYFSSQKYFHDKKLTSYLEVTELLIRSSLEQLVFERNIRKRRII